MTLSFIKKILRYFLISAGAFFLSAFILLHIPCVKKTLSKALITLGKERGFDISFEDFEFTLPCRFRFINIQVQNQKKETIVRADEIVSFPLLLDLPLKRITFIYLSAAHGYIDVDAVKQDSTSASSQIYFSVFHFSFPNILLKTTLKNNVATFSCAALGSVSLAGEKGSVQVELSNISKNFLLKECAFFCKKEKNQLSYSGMGVFQEQISEVFVKSGSRCAFSGKSSLHNGAFETTDIDWKVYFPKAQLPLGKNFSAYAMLEANGNLSISPSKDLTLKLSHFFAKTYIQKDQLLLNIHDFSCSGKIDISALHDYTSSISWEFPTCSLNSLNGSSSGNADVVLEQDHLFSISSSMRGIFKGQDAHIPLAVTYSTMVDPDLFSVRFVATSLPFHIDYSMNSTKETKKIDGYVSLQDLSILFPEIKKGEIIGSVSLNSSKETQQLSVSLHASDVVLPNASVKDLSFSAHTHDALHSPILFQCEGKDLSGNTWSLEEGSAYGELFLPKNSFSFNVLPAKGCFLQNKLFLEGSFDGNFSNDACSVSVQSCSGSFNNCPIVVTKPTHITYQHGLIQEAQIFAHPGSLGTCSMVWTQKDENSCETSLSFEEISLHELFLRSQMHGKLSGSISYASSNGKISADASVTGSKLRYAVLGAEGAEFAVGIQSTIEKGHANTTFCVGGTSIIEPICGQLSFPIREDHNTPFFTVDMQKAITGSIRGSFSLADLLGNWTPKGVRLDAKTTTDLTVSGTLQKPLFHGPVLLKEGLIEIAATAQRIVNIEMIGSASGETISVDSITGTDGEKGTLKGSGAISYTDSGYHWDADLSCNEMQAVSLDFATVDFRGAVHLQGNESSLHITSNPVVTYAKMDLSQKQEEHTPPLHIVYEEEKEDTSNPYNIFLHVNIDGKKGLVVTGKGFSSLWKGRILLSGEVLDLSATGKLRCSKGSLTLGSRKLEVSDGLIDLRGNVFTESKMRIISKIEMPTVTARLIISGSLQNPKITLQSTPFRPENEILSLILFNKEYADISPFESLQLAHSALKLRQSKSPLDIVDNVKETLGLDFFDISSASPSPFSITQGALDPSDIDSLQKGNGTDVNLRVGKYFWKRFAVVLSRNFPGSINRFGVEAHVAQNVTATAEVGDDQSGIISLKWKKDY